MKFDLQEAQNGAEIRDIHGKAFKYIAFNPRASVSRRVILHDYDDCYSFCSIEGRQHPNGSACFYTSPKKTKIYLYDDGMWYMSPRAGRLPTYSFEVEEK